MHILLIEDDREAAAYIGKGLRECGHVVDHADNGADGLEMASSGGFDVLVVDRMLHPARHHIGKGGSGEMPPSEKMRDGLSLVQELRAQGITTPVLFLSALGEVSDRIRGLRAGGDDYLVKPFAFAELQARVEALLRRRRLDAADAGATRLLVGDLEMDLLAHTVARSGRPIDLQPREFQLLEYLMRHAGQVVTRTMLLENVWEYHFDPRTNVIDVHIWRLRAKLDKNFPAPMLHTVRGAGYMLRAEGEAGAESGDSSEHADA